MTKEENNIRLYRESNCDPVLFIPNTIDTKCVAGCIELEDGVKHHKDCFITKLYEEIEELKKLAVSRWVIITDKSIEIGSLKKELQEAYKLLHEFEVASEEED